MSADLGLWLAAGTLALVALTAVWLVWPQRSPSSDVDPRELPVGTYWWRIEQRGAFTWRWHAYRRTRYSNTDTTYDAPIGTSASCLVHTRGAALRAVRRAVRYDVRARRYAAEAQRGVVERLPLSRGYRGRDVGPHGKPPTTPATEAGIAQAAAAAGLTAERLEVNVEAFKREVIGQWPPDEPPPVLGRDARGEYRTLHELADAAASLRMGDGALTVTTKGVAELPHHRHVAWARWLTPSLCTECGLGTGSSGPVQLEDHAELIVVEPKRLVKLVGQDD